jgi:hypothetical protein
MYKDRKGIHGASLYCTSKFQTQKTLGFLSLKPETHFDSDKKVGCYQPWNIGRVHGHEQYIGRVRQRGTIYWSSPWVEKT